MNKNKEDSKISETRIAQPAIMAIQIGLMELWKSLGITPEGIVGHSIGEVAAAYGAGSLTLEQAVNVIYNRSKEQDKASGKGKMLATGLPFSKSMQITEKHRGKISIAALNGPEATVLSGDAAPLEEIAKELEEKEIFSRFLKINVPFHSHYMDMTKDEMLKSLKDLKPQRSKIPLYSTVTGFKENGLHLTANYWYKNVRDTVYFIMAIEKMINDGFNYFIEIAPHPILGAGVDDMLISKKRNGYITSSLSRNIEKFENNIEYEVNDILSAAAKTHIATNRVEFLNLLKDQNKNPNSIKLPNYAWDHKEYWSESREHKEARLENRIHPFIKSLTKSLIDKNAAIAELDLNHNRETFLADHQIGGIKVFPGTAHFEIAATIGKEIYGKTFSHLENIEFKRALFLSDEEDIKVRFELKPSGEYGIYSKSNNSDWTNNSTGKICHKDSKLTLNENQKEKEESKNNLSNLKKRINQKLSVEEFYDNLKEGGLFYGPHFKLIKEMWKNDDGEILAKIELPKEDEDIMHQYNMIPNLSDAILHLMLGHPEDGVYLPHQCQKFQIYRKSQKTAWSHVKISSYDQKFLIGDINAFNDEGDAIFKIKNITIKYLENSFTKEENIYSGIYDYKWFKRNAKNKLQNNNADILLFSNDTSYNPLREELTKDGNNIIEINKGNKFQQINENHYIINSNSKEDFVKLFTNLKNKKDNISKIINLCPINYKINDNDNCKKLSQLSEDLLMTNLYLFQEIAKIENQEIYIYQITKNADLIDKKKDKEINFLQGSLYGMGRVFINEYPNHQLRMIDIGCKKLEDNISSLIYEINKEEKIPYETEIAIRDYGRFARKLVKIKKKTDLETEISFKKDATYLITGGASGLGLTLANWMFDKGARHFALMSRSGPKYDRDKEIISKMQKSGANIIWQEVKGDVSKEEDVNKIVSYIKDNMPPLKGIIHSAGLIDDAAYPNMTKDKFFKIYNPKALGAWNLHRATLDAPLDLFLLISSVSSFLGIAGQSNYSTTNNFINYFSLFRSAKDLSTRSISPGILNSDYSGMSKVDTELVQMAYRNIGLISVSKNNFFNKLEKISSSKLINSLLISINWKNLSNTSPHLNNLFLMNDVLKKEAFSNGESKKINIKSAVLNNEKDSHVAISDILKNSLSKILGIDSDDVYINISINKIGLDSIMINQFRNWIHSNIEIDISLMHLANNPTIEDLSFYIKGEIVRTHTKKENNFIDISNIDYNGGINISANKWIINKKDYRAKTRIFCLHPVGTGASIFSYFIFNPPKNTEIIALQMPGRENRLDEEYYYDNMDKLVEDLVQQITPEINGPTIFWGHSWGGVSLYEVIKYLRRNNIKEYKNIKELIVTGSIAPQLTKPWKDRDSIKETARKDSTIDKIISTVSYIDDENYLRSIIPIMKKDMEMIMTYQYQEEEKLNIPILAFGAKEDDVVLLDELQEWKKQTNDNFQLYEVSGDHWFLSRNKEFIIEKIEKSIMEI